MKTKYIYTLCVMLTVALSLSSCLKGEEEDDYSLYDDMAITDFSLAKVYRHIHKTTSTNPDTIVVKELTDIPAFTIDQYKYQIYNREPIPADCDLKHVLVSLSTKNNGQIAIKSMVSDSLLRYQSTDSLDFSQPREIRVYALNGSGYRAYTVTINTKETESKETLWNEYTAGSPEIPEALYQDVVLQRDILGGDEGDAFLLSRDGGITWTNELIGEGEDVSLLPVSGIAWVTFPFPASKNANYELLVGNCEANAEACTIWRKVVDKDAPTAARWVNIPFEANKEYNLPKMAPMSLVLYDSYVYAIGNNGKIYKTRDGGITWKESDDFSLPADRESDDVKVTTDENGSLWLLEISSGRVWKGTK